MLAALLDTDQLYTLDRRAASQQNGGQSRRNIVSIEPSFWGATGDAMDELDPLDRISVEQLLRASKSEAYEHVFFLGPFARRVSFASQQNRALNLIWALLATSEIEPGQLIAVIGGGIAGAMAAASLLNLGCNVDLYESNREALTRQSTSKHRYIHPTIIRWPEQPVSETTELPYFDWVSGKCSKVVKSLHDEWLELERSSVPRLRFEPLAEVQGFTEPPGGQRRIAVQTAKTTRLSNERYYAVIVTSGFANEDTKSPSGDENSKPLPTYWDSEDLDREATEGKIPNFLISGAGDGGLVDAIRIAYEGFDDGEFIIDVARQLDASDEWLAEGGGRQRIMEAEAAAAADPPKAILSGSKELQKTYIAWAKRLPPAVETIVETALRRDRPALVTIYSVEDVPFSPLTAPIHKLLLAYAVNESVVRHYKRQVADWGPMYIAHGEYTGSLEIPPTSTIRAKGRAVIRHGAKPNFARFLEPWPGAAGNLIEKQRDAAANLDLQIWRTASIPLKKWLPTSPFPEALKERRAKVEILVHRILEVMVGHIYMIDDVGFTLAVDPEVRSMPGIETRLDSLPSSIFGFKFSWEWRGSSATDSRPLGGSPTAPPDADLAVRPGKVMIAALQGRLGPLVANAQGEAFALIASHTAFSADGRHEGPIYDGNDCIIGSVEHHGRPTGVASDLALLRIAEFRAIELDYGPFGPILATVDPAAAFGRPVFMVDARGEVHEGVVSATYSPVRFRLSGQTDKLDVHDAIRVRPADAAKGFGEPGDSGAPVVDVSGNAVGVLLGADEHFSYVVPVAPYMARSGLDLLRNARAASERGLASEALPELAHTARLLAHANRDDFDYVPFLLPIEEEAEEAC